MDLQTLLAMLRQRDPQQSNPYYNVQQVGGQGILGQGLQNQATQIDQQTGGQPMPQQAPMPPPQGLLGGAPQMSAPPTAAQGAPSKEAIIAAVLQSGDPVRIAQLRHMGWIK
jgi:hypothetical protein